MGTSPEYVFFAYIVGEGLGWFCSREIMVWLVPMGWIVLTVCSGDIALSLLVLGLWSDYIHQSIHTPAPDIFLQ